MWFFAYLWPGMGDAVMQLLPGGVIMIALMWGLGEVILASIAGAWLYTE